MLPGSSSEGSWQAPLAGLLNFVPQSFSSWMPAVYWITAVDGAGLPVIAVQVQARVTTGVTAIFPRQCPRQCPRQPSASVLSVDASSSPSVMVSGPSSPVSVPESPAVEVDSDSAPDEELEEVSPLPSPSGLDSRVSEELPVASEPAVVVGLVVEPEEVPSSLVVAPEVTVDVAELAACPVEDDYPRWHHRRCSPAGAGRGGRGQFP